MENKVALVTGGAVGIGKGIACELAKAGYDVAISYYESEKHAHDVCKELKSMGVRAMPIQADLSCCEGVDKLFREFSDNFARLDVFVNNSGITKKMPFLETTEETFDSICDLDLKGSFFCIRNAAKRMANNHTRGSIIVISSNNYKAHFADVSVYGSVKAGLTKLAEHAAIELAEYGIRVNTIAPGWTDTGAARLDDKQSTFYKIPLQRWCTPAEIGQTVLFLSSEAAASITGATLVMDGGALLVSDKMEKYRKVHI